MFIIRNKIKSLAKKLIAKQYFFNFHLQKQSYNLFYQVDNSIKYIFNINSLNDMLDLFTKDELIKIYISLKCLFIKQHNKKFTTLSEKIELDNSSSVIITIINDISMYNMNYGITELFKNKLKLDLKLRKTISMQGGIRDMDIKHFICKSQEQFWKDYHLSIQDTVYELDFRLALYDLFKASLIKKNTHIIRNNDKNSYYLHMSCYK